MREKIIGSIMAGAYISMGAVVYLCIPNVIVASLFFSTGIFLVLNFHNMLFTRVCPLCTYNGSCGPADMAVSWAGNWAGAVLVAVMVHFSRLEGKILERVSEVGAAKLADDPVSLVIMGIFCALFVGFAVIAGMKYKKGSFAQIFFVWLFITAFVFGGFEHVVADMFYLSVYSLAVEFRPGAVVMVLLLVTVGNVIGGLFVGRIEKQYLC